MMRMFLFVLLTAGFLQAAHAANGPTAGERVVGAAFKTMAKGYIAAVDIEQLKQKNIERIRSMKDYWFEKQYDDVYAVIKDLSPQIKRKYRITPAMTKAEVIAVIRGLDKNKIYEIIDAVPDQAISAQFNEQVRREGFEGKDLMTRVRMIWDRITAAVNKP